MPVDHGDITRPNPRRVAVLVEASNAYGRGLLRGIAAHVRTHGRWTIQLSEMGRGGPLPEWLDAWRGDGILARIENPETAEAVADKGVPAVDLSAGRLLPSLAWVEVDEASVAHAAYDHLAGRGLENLAYCGDPRFSWSPLRGDAFAAVARRHGRSIARFDLPGVTERGEDRVATLTRWLGEQPLPLGVLACYDRMGREVLEACRAARLLVPEQVAVLGVDDDEVLCDLCDPPLSSVSLNGRGAGRAAAELLARAMDGEALDPAGHLVEPLGVAERRSTDILAVEDPMLAEALHFIHHHAAEGIGVEDVLRAVTVSRRALEVRFKATLGRSPHQEILRTRMERIRTLLLETELTIAEIARRTGYSHVEYMTVAFKRSLGCTPTEYRARAR